MDEDNNCPTHRRPCISRKEENYFFRLSRYQKEIEVRFIPVTPILSRVHWAEALEAINPRPSVY